MKTNKKIFLVFGISLVSLSIPFYLTSCSLFSNKIDDKINQPQDKPSEDNNLPPSDIINPTISDYEKINNMQFISERTFSLKFTSYESRNVGYGTGWIFGKDMLESNSYYIATNLHVASFIANGGKQTYEPIYNENLNTYEYKLTNNTKFNEIQFGQIIDDSDKNNIVVGTTKTEGLINETKYLQKINLDYVSIAYTTFDMFNNMQLYNEYNVYNDSFIKNATQDLAILKIDFSKIEYVNYFYDKKIDFIKKSLEAYDKNPTRFAKSYDYKKDKITIAGFPANEGLGKWSSSRGLISNNIIQGLKINRSSWKSFINNDINIEDIKKNYALLNNISYASNNYASQINVSLQSLFSNLNLQGGSSGSMAINEKNEVVGIYWGAYNFSNGTTLGAIDLFKNNINYYSNGKNIILMPYDTIFNFSEKIKNTNINLN